MVASPGNPDAKPYGLHRVWITPYTDTDGTQLGDTSYRLPLAQTFAFTENEDTDTLNGDDKKNVAIAGKGAQVDGSLEAGGLDFMTFSIISGAQLIESGVEPNIKRVIRKRGSDQRPYFRVEGQVLSNGGGDTIGRVFRCKASGKIQADAKYGTFMVPSIDIQGTPMPGDDDDYLWEFEFNEQKTTLGTTPVPNPLQIPSNLSVGLVHETTVALSWSELPTALSYVLQQSADGVSFTDISGGAGGTPSDGSTTITGLTLGTIYYFRVAAVFTQGTGAYSSPVLVTTASFGS